MSGSLEGRLYYFNLLTLKAMMNHSMNLSTAQFI